MAVKEESVNLKLKERIKELRCLYELSRIALQSGYDLEKVAHKMIHVLPAALQYPDIAEAQISVHTHTYATPGFKPTQLSISAAIQIDGKPCGQIQVSYRTSKHLAKPVFLQEEKHLLKAVAGEFSLLCKRIKIAEEKEALQHQLEHVERLAFMGELTAGIAHELNEPLGRILGFAQLIKKEGDLSTQQADDLERILKASLYAREVIKKLMFFSRQMPQQLTSVNLNELILNILYFIDVRYQQRAILIKKNLAPSLPLIQADPVQISQVLVNILTNAIHAMDEGGTLEIRTLAKDKNVLLRVKDTGHGMTADVRKKIFEPFYTTKPMGQGTGLGLSVVQGIVTTHQGKITVQSTPGKGSRFDILLPLKQRK